MAEIKIQKHKDLRQQMKSVARGEKRASKDAGRMSFESADVLLRLLTKENRELLRLIRDEKPQSVAELGRLSARAQPNLLRTLGKLEAFGLIRMTSDGNRRIPVAAARTLSVQIDLFSLNDRLEMA